MHRVGGYAGRHVSVSRPSRLVLALALGLILTAATIVVSTSGMPTPPAAPPEWVPLSVTVQEAQIAPFPLEGVTPRVPVSRVTVVYSVGASSFVASYGKIGLLQPGDRYEVLANPSNYAETTDPADRALIVGSRALGALALMCGTLLALWYLRRRRAYLSTVVEGSEDSA